MAFDGIVTKTIVAELNTCLVNGKINKVFEPNKNEILLGIYSSGKNYCLNISIDSVNYRLSLSNNSKPNPQNVLNFRMVLRKHLIGGHIKRIYSNGLERVVFIDIDCHNELNDLITKTLVIELMGKHSNIILLNSNSIIIDSLRHLDKFDKSNRDIFPGSKYISIVSDKLDFTTLKSFDAFYESLDISDDNFSLSSTLSKKYNGFGKNNITFLLKHLNISDHSPSIKDLEVLYLYFKNLLSNLSEKATILEVFNTKKDYFVYFDENKQDCLEVNFFIDNFYYSKETFEQFQAYRDNVLKLVLNRIEKIKDRISNINSKIKECDRAELYRLYGELITSNLYKIPDYPQSEVILENYYDNNNLIKIPLDNTISPSKNAKVFFKKYRKLQNTITIVSKQKELVETELAYLDSIVYELSEVKYIADIDNIYSEICDNLIYDKNANTVNNHISNMTGNLSKTKHSKDTSSLTPAKYEIDGYTVLVGKNNKQNDYLTCRLAQNSDIWFHTKDIHGSHVVLKLDNTAVAIEQQGRNSAGGSSYSKLDISKTSVPDSVLYKCASLAAYYSKARMSQNVPVDYTYIKYVKKPNGAKPGMVIYTNNKTLYVNPQNKF